MVRHVNVDMLHIWLVQQRAVHKDLKPAPLNYTLPTFVWDENFTCAILRIPAA